MQFGERDVGLGRNAFTKGIIMRRQLRFGTAAGSACGYFAGYASPDQSLVNIGDAELETAARPHTRQFPYQLPQSHAHASPENMACPLRPPYRFDTKVESQIQHSEKPADSVNPENALARSTRDLLNTLAAIAERGAGFKSLGDPWADTTTPHGKLMITVVGGLAEFERHLILSRTSEGRDRAKARGVKFGRKPKLNKHQRDEALARVWTHNLIQIDCTDKGCGGL